MVKYVNCIIHYARKYICIYIINIYTSGKSMVKFIKNNNYRNTKIFLLSENAVRGLNKY